MHTDKCIYCEKCDTAEHAVFECPRFTQGRLRMESETGKIPTAENIVDLALENKKMWDSTLGIVHEIMQRKEVNMLEK